MGELVDLAAVRRRKRSQLLTASPPLPREQSSLAGGTYQVTWTPKGPLVEKLTK